MVVPTTYLGNIAYYATLFSAESYEIEIYDNYVKQSFRSRCEILSANGRMTLSIPIVRNYGKKQLMKDTEIEYVMSWQKQHWRSIVSAYRSSPFFDEFEEDFEKCFSKKERFLIDFNYKLHETITECFGVKYKGDFTSSYVSDTELQERGEACMREELSSKKNNNIYCVSPYYQVFSDKFEFENNLSVIDYLFCEGVNFKQSLDIWQKKEL